jgi:phosphopentomutase
MRRTLDAVRGGDDDFIFTNLVDFDTMWGHRNDARAYALGLEDFDSYLTELLPALSVTDLLIVTSDHGNDPTTPGSDHSRENVPLVVYHAGITRALSLGVRTTFADVGATVAEALGADAPSAGRSFLGEIAGFI